MTTPQTTTSIMASTMNTDTLPIIEINSPEISAVDVKFTVTDGVNIILGITTDVATDFDIDVITDINDGTDVADTGVTTDDTADVTTDATDVTTGAMPTTKSKDALASIVVIISSAISTWAMHWYSPVSIVSFAVNILRILEYDVELFIIKSVIILGSLLFDRGWEFLLQWLVTESIELDVGILYSKPTVHISMIVFPLYRISVLLGVTSIDTNGDAVQYGEVQCTNESKIII